MLKVIFHRLLVSIPLVFAVTFLTFFLNTLAPGDLAYTMLGMDSTPAQYQALREELGLNKPLVAQYGDWLFKAVRGDLGISHLTKESVTELLNTRLGVSLSIMVGVLVICVSVGLVLGVFSALKGGWVGRALDTLSLLGLIFPSFWVALVLMSVFAVWLNWLPATGYTMFSESPLKWALGLVLPVLAVSLSSTTVVAKQTRDAMNDVMGRDYIRALRACGLPEGAVVWKHGLRNAALPVITVLSIVMMGAVSSAVFVERAFVLPGLGSMALSAVDSKDFAILQGCTLYFCFISIAINLLVDLCYGWLNPKVSVG